MNTLYSMRRLGNSYKVRLALAQLQIPYRLVEIDVLRGESRTPEFLAKNPSGRVPLLEVAPGRYIAESNAILWYLAGGTELAPEDRVIVNGLMRARPGQKVTPQEEGAPPPAPGAAQVMK